MRIKRYINCAHFARKRKLNFAKNLVIKKKSHTDSPKVEVFTTNLHSYLYITATRAFPKDNDETRDVDL